MSLKDKVINGLLWSFAEKFAARLINFISGILLARLLVPRDFGLIGMLMIFIELANTLVRSGLNQALIRKTDCRDVDYSTLFIFNLIASAGIYGLLFLAAGLIAKFYNEPQLELLIRVLALGIFINAFTIIQRTLLVKRLDFKLLTQISILSSLIAGTGSIVMAYYGHGVWSLVYKYLLQYFIAFVLIWYWNKWWPRLTFSISSFKQQFRFGGYLTVFEILSVLDRQIYQVVIGKFYPAAQLGQYTKAYQFKQLPSESVGNIIESVSYPALSSIAKDKNRLGLTFNRLIRSTMLVSIVLMVAMAAVARELTVVLMGTNWIIAGEYLQLLCFSALFIPLNKLNLAMLKVAGRSDLILRIGLYTKLLLIPVLYIAVYWGIREMIYGMMVYELVLYGTSAYYSGLYSGHGLSRQLKYMVPSLLVAVPLFTLTALAGRLLDWSYLLTLVLKVVLGAAIVIGILEGSKLDDYLYLKKIAKEKWKG